MNWIKVASVEANVQTADCDNNVNNIIGAILRAKEQDATIMVTQELAVTGYACGDLFFHDLLLDSAEKGLFCIARETRSVDALLFIGLPVRVHGRVFNAAAVIAKGKILGIIPKTFLTDKNGLFENRYFSPAPDINETIILQGEEVPFGNRLLFACNEDPSLIVGAEIGTDRTAFCTPGGSHAANGGTIIVNLSADGDMIGTKKSIRAELSAYSKRLCCGYVYCNASDRESAASVLFDGRKLIFENGELLQETYGETAISDADPSSLAFERRKNRCASSLDGYRRIPFSVKLKSVPIERKYGKFPFMFADTDSDGMEDTMGILAKSLRLRLERAFADSAVIGVSGGLDSCLTLLVAMRALKMTGRCFTVYGVTMPCFGTTDRTYKNACELVKKLGANLLEIPIGESVKTHLADIGHDESEDVTYENAQARERTQVLMDLANMNNGLVIGTGDMSEAALGFSTYNGDHMSMYAANSAVPKTLVRQLVEFEIKKMDKDTGKILRSILDTPVSPELLPPENGQIAQVTEDIVGPYELHDFFLYYIIGKGFTPEKVSVAAQNAFGDIYDEKEIKKWLNKFLSRFFSQQFKRGCSPDSVKLSDRSIAKYDFFLPSDLNGKLWKDNL